MTRTQRLWAVYGTLGIAAAIGGAVLVLASDAESNKVWTILLGEVVGLSFVFAGLLGVTFRPTNGSGRLLALVGFTFFAGALGEANSSFWATVGSAVGLLFVGAFVHLLVAYPTGRLTTKVERRLVEAAYVLVIAFPVTYLLFADELDPSCKGECPDNAFLVHESHAAAVAIEAVASVVAAGVLIATIVIIARRWRSASAAYRRSLRFVLWTGGAAVGLFVLQIAFEPVLPNAGDVVLEAATIVAFICVPFAFAVGLLRGRRAGAAVGRLVADLGPAPAPGQLRDALREVLGDPTLELGYWLEDLPGFVDIEGRPFDPGEQGAATIVYGETGRIGVLVHDPVLLEERGLLDGVVSAARLALENERLHADLQARVHELERERDFTRLVVDTAPAYFCVLDAAGRILRFNVTLSQVTGISGDDVRGREFWEVFTTAADADGVRGSLALAAVAGRTEPHEATLVAADGSKRIVAWSEVVIPDEQGQLEFVLASGLDVTEQKRHEETLRLVADEQAALRRVATLVAKAPSEGELLTSVTSEVARLFDAQAAHLWRYEGQGVYLVGGWNVSGTPTRGETFHTPDPNTIVGRIAATFAPARRDDYSSVGGLIGDLVRNAGLRSAIGAPIVVEGTLWGAIVISTEREEPFPPAAEGRLGDFAALVAQAVANADARVALANVADEQAALRRVATLVAAGADQDELVTAVTAAIGRLFGAQSASTMRWDGDSVRVIGGWHEPGAQATVVGRTFTFGGDTVTARVVNSGRPIRIDSRDDIHSVIGREIWDELGLHASIGAPIVVDGRVWGIITASRRTPNDPFPPGAEHRLGDFAALVAQAIANAESRREVAALADEQAALRRVATLVAAGRPEAVVLETLAGEIGVLFGAQRVNLVRWQGVHDQVTILGGWADAPEHELPPGAAYRTPGVNPTLRVLETGLVAVGDESAQARDRPGADWHELRTRHVVAAPVIVAGTLWGAMTATAPEGETFASGSELRLKGFASLMAQAIANAEAAEELRASRARIVEAADDARRKLERNLHDGAQQRLVAVSISLRLAIARLAAAPEDAQSLMVSAAEELTHAIDELRELARGIHPAILTDRGLGPALEALAGRSPLPVDVDHDLDDRLPPSVEAAAYYVVSESLTNVAKYAEATAVEVRVSRRNGVARVEVVDDGIGGADPTLGSGLRGLADRVEALDGRLGVESPPAAGTRVWAEIPVV